MDKINAWTNGLCVLGVLLSLGFEIVESFYISWFNILNMVVYFTQAGLLVFSVLYLRKKINLMENYLANDKLIMIHVVNFAVWTFLSTIPLLLDNYQDSFEDGA